MKKKNLTNQELSKIELSLFKSAQENKTELSEILNSPNLFNSIKRQINQERKSQTESSIKWLNWRVASYALVSCLIIVFLLTTVFYFAKSASQIAVETVSIPNGERQIPSIETTPSQITAEKPNNFTKTKTLKVTKTPERMVKVKPAPLPVKPTQSKKVLPKASKILLENASPFYAINGSENLPSQNQGMSIIRGDFSRAELLAFGVEVLTDIGDSKVKSEILVGDDGQPRAIRFIR